MILLEKAVRVEKPLWGWEEILVNDYEYCLKRLNFFTGRQFSLQYHKNKKETHIVERGIILMKKGKDGFATREEDILELKVLRPGEIVTINQYTAHQCGSLNGISTILEVSTHHEDSDTYKLEKTVEGITNVIPEDIIKQYINR